jgi:hypothetical protein
VAEFVSENDLQTFEVWLKEIQGIDPEILEPNEFAQWRSIHQDVMAKSAASPKVGYMKLHAGPGEHLYAVAIREASKLWLTLWVRRSRKGEIFVIIPRADRAWDPHLSYHLDGTVHSKSFNRKFGLPGKRQPLNESFKGSEHLGMFAGHGKSIGAICNPADFSGVVEVEPGVLGPRHGWVAVDLVEPNCEPTDLTTINARIVKKAVFSHALPWVVIRVGQHAELKPASRGAASIEPA